MKKIRIGKSSIAGRGIIAEEFIKKGEYIMSLEGPVHHRHYTSRSQYRNEETWIPVGIHKWVNPSYPFKYLNHSCEPSAGFKTPRKVYALRDIKSGEEISVDYSTIEYTPIWAFQCHCKTPTCRKLVRSIQYLPEKKYRRYLPYIPRFLQKVYLSSHKSGKIGR